MVELPAEDEVSQFSERNADLSIDAFEAVCKFLLQFRISGMSRTFHVDQVDLVAFGKIVDKLRSPGSSPGIRHMGIVHRQIEEIFLPGAYFASPGFFEDSLLFRLLMMVTGTPAATA